MNPLHVYSRTYSPSYTLIKHDLVNRSIDLRPNWPTFGLTKSNLVVDLSLHKLILKLSLGHPLTSASLKRDVGDAEQEFLDSHVFALPYDGLRLPLWECRDRPNHCCTWTIPLKYSYMSLRIDMRQVVEMHGFEKNRAKLYFNIPCYLATFSLTFPIVAVRSFERGCCIMWLQRTYSLQSYESWFTSIVWPIAFNVRFVFLDFTTRLWFLLPSGFVSPFSPVPTVFLLVLFFLVIFICIWIFF